jgi:hypothetical protein
MREKGDTGTVVDVETGSLRAAPACLGLRKQARRKSSTRLWKQTGVALNDLPVAGGSPDDVL